jgi:hypothetical protein
MQGRSWLAAAAAMSRNIDILFGVNAGDSYGATHKQALRRVPGPTPQRQAKYLHGLTGHALPLEH